MVERQKEYATIENCATYTQRFSSWTNERRELRRNCGTQLHLEMAVKLEVCFK